MPRPSSADAEAALRGERPRGPSRSISLRANRRAGLVGLALLALSSACGSGGGSAAACQHPCDLAQTVRVVITGATPTNVTVGDPCGGGGVCPATGCGDVKIYLKNGGPGPAEDGGSDLVCHVTVTLTTGQTEEVDVTARYTAAACCPGYEFVMPTLGLAFGTDAAP